MRHTVGGIVAIALLLASSQGVTAQVRTDGTVGPRRSLTGPAIRIGDDLGRRAGQNLFHSFATFSLAPGESATFTGPASVHNVIARVTGGAPSTIDGRLACDIPGANLYLLNPSGVVFGSGAALDVSGAFAVSTANELRLADGGRFVASVGGRPSVLTSASPAAFGFLARTAPAGVSFHGSNSIGADGSINDTDEIDGAPGKSFSIVAGPVAIRGQTLTAAGGQVNVVSIAGPATVDVSGNSARVTTTSPLGAVTLDPAAAIDVSGDRRGGGVTIRAGSLAVTNATITTAGSSGRGGNVSLLVPGGPIAITGPAAAVVSFSDGTARGGDVRITAGSLAVSDSAEIQSSNAGSGRGGDVHLDARRVTITGPKSPGDFPTGVIVDNPAGLDAAAVTGSPGGVFVRAGVLEFVRGGGITDTTRGQGRGGDVTVVARHVIADGRGDADDLTGLATSAENRVDGQGLPLRVAHAGAAGSVTVRAGTFTAINGGGVAADTFSPAAAGDVRVRAGTILLDAGGGTATTGIDATSGQLGGGDPRTGPSGSIDVWAGSLVVRAGAVVRANTFGQSPAGAIRVSAAHLLLDGAGANGQTTGIGAQVETGATGSAGQVRVDAGSLRVTNGALLSTVTTGAGAAGDLSVVAGRVELDAGGSVQSNSTSASRTALAGNVAVHARGAFTIDGAASVTARSRFTRAGRIDLSSGDAMTIDGGTVTAQADRAAGGDVRLTAPLFITLDGAATVSARARGDGGNVSIDPLVLTLAGTSRVDASGGANGGKVTLAADQISQGNRSVVTATGGTGRAGSVELGPAETDIARSITQLPSELRPPELTLQPRCGLPGSFSAFLVSGRGGVPGAGAVGLWQFDVDDPPATTTPSAPAP